MYHAGLSKAGLSDLLCLSGASDVSSTKFCFFSLRRLRREKDVSIWWCAVLNFVLFYLVSEYGTL